MKKAPNIEAIIDGATVEVFAPRDAAVVITEIEKAIIPVFRCYDTIGLLPFGKLNVFLARGKEEVYKAMVDIMRDNLPELLEEIVEQEKLILQSGPLLTRHLIYDNEVNFIINLEEGSSKEYILGILNQELGTMAFNEELKKRGYDLNQAEEYFHNLVGPVALLKPLDLGKVNFEMSAIVARNTITNTFKSSRLLEFLLGFEDKNKDIFDRTRSYQEDQAKKHIDTLQKILHEEPSRHENIYQNRLTLFIDTVGAASYMVPLLAQSKAYRTLAQKVLSAIDEVYGNELKPHREKIYKITSDALKKMSTIPEKSEVLAFYEAMWELFDFRILKDLEF